MINSTIHGLMFACIVTLTQEETVFEAAMRKLAEKKKLRKQQKQARQQDIQAAKEDSHKASTTTAAAKKMKQKHGKDESVELDDKRRQESLELMFADSDKQVQGDYDMIEVLKRDKSEGHKKKGRFAKKKNENKEDSVDSFQVDVSDNRFGRLFAGDANFGIDPTSSDFKETKGMKEVLTTIRKNRDSSNSNQNLGKSGIEKSQHSAESMASTKQPEVSNLVDQLKKKFKNVKAKK